jgi:hypothetical protein
MFDATANAHLHVTKLRERLVAIIQDANVGF